MEPTHEQLHLLSRYKRDTHAVQTQREEIARLRGHLWWREEWYSICSRHQKHDPACSTCQGGRWINVGRAYMSNVAFAISPRLWRWWTGRPF